MTTLTITITLSDEAQEAILTATNYKPGEGKPTPEAHIKRMFAQVGEQAVRRARSMAPVDGITVE